MNIFAVGEKAEHLARAFPCQKKDLAKCDHEKYGERVFGKSNNMKTEPDSAWLDNISNWSQIDGGKLFSRI